MGVRKRRESGRSFQSILIVRAVVTILPPSCRVVDHWLLAASGGRPPNVSECARAWPERSRTLVKFKKKKKKTTISSKDYPFRRQHCGQILFIGQFFGRHNFFRKMPNNKRRGNRRSGDRNDFFGSVSIVLCVI